MSPRPTAERTADVGPTARSCEDQWQTWARSPRLYGAMANVGPRPMAEMVADVGLRPTAVRIDGGRGPAAHG